MCFKAPNLRKTGRFISSLHFRNNILNIQICDSINNVLFVVNLLRPLSTKGFLEYKIEKKDLEISQIA